MLVLYSVGFSIFFFCLRENESTEKNNIYKYKPNFFYALLFLFFTTPNISDSYLFDLYI